MTGRLEPLGPDDPTQIGGYQLKARIPGGGMGSVYLSFTPGASPVVVKIIKREYADDLEFRRRFKNEVAYAQRVQSPYIAQILGAGSDAPVPWLATAYIQGPSLKDAVTEHGPLPLLTVFRLLAGTAEGIASVHAQGLIHRDLKPGNVLLALDGPRVIDFGIAYATNSASLTRAGHAIGTPAFMAPEQIEDGRVSEATDVWAFGHLAVYAATGHAAFGEGGDSVLFHRICNDEPRLDDCPEPLRPLVRRCLAKNPADRPSISQIRDYGRQALRGQTMLLAGGSWLPQPIRESLAGYNANTSSIPLVAHSIPNTNTIADALGRSSPESPTRRPVGATIKATSARAIDGTSGVVLCGVAAFLLVTVNIFADLFVIGSPESIYSFTPIPAGIFRNGAGSLAWIFTRNHPFVILSTPEYFLVGAITGCTVAVLISPLLPWLVGVPIRRVVAVDLVLVFFLLGWSVLGGISWIGIISAFAIILWVLWGMAVTIGIALMVALFIAWVSTM